MRTHGQASEAKEGWAEGNKFTRLASPPSSSPSWSPSWSPWCTRTPSPWCSPATRAPWTWCQKLTNPRNQGRSVSLHTLPSSKVHWEPADRHMWPCQLKWKKWFLREWFWPATIWKNICPWCLVKAFNSSTFCSVSFLTSAPQSPPSSSSSSALWSFPWHFIYHRAYMPGMCIVLWNNYSYSG